MSQGKMPAGVALNRCEWTDACTFFNDEVGYSIDLFAVMRVTYCLGDSSTCARLAAMDALPVDEIPDDLLPTDHDRLEQLITEYRRRQDREAL